MSVETSKGATLSIQTTLQKSILDFLQKAMKKGVFDAVLIPMSVPAQDSYAYVLIKDHSLLKDAMPFPPVMPVQGAKAVSSVTRLGNGTLNIAAVMRPCEIRATIELAKLEQTNLEHITLISTDCFGVMPLSDFITNPQKAQEIFENDTKKQERSRMRPVCQICDNSSMVADDLHIGTHGAKQNAFFIIPNSQKGKNALDTLDISLTTNMEPWQAKVKEHTKKQQDKRKDAHKKLKAQIGGYDNLPDTFSQCINCHNCMRVCPICHCRLCYFDSDKVKHPSEEYLQAAKSKGSIRFLPDTMLFHMGRMMHMSLSCVSCGCCEDACPVSIPVAQVFSMIADETQGIFKYVAGRTIDEPLPLKTYEEDELHEVEDYHD
jgi:formate dehydrogenase subunit beta